jgi:type 1 glutamine amidotransferase
MIAYIYSMNFVRYFLLLLVFNTAILETSQAQVAIRKLRVLIYTRSDSLSHEGKKAFIHDNIASCAQAVTDLGSIHGFHTFTTNNPSIFSEKELSGYDIIFFASTNNDAFSTDAQRLAFRRFVEAGGGVVGMHSVMGTERAWRWFKNMLGGTFAWHAPNQVYRIRNIRPDHPSMKGVPAVWEKKDECYFAKELYPGIEVLMAHELASLNKKQSAEIQKWAGHYQELYPAVWYHAYDGGHIWISQLGHDIANYTDPTFVNHLWQGLRFIASKVKKNPAKAYALEIDIPLTY